MRKLINQLICEEVRHIDKLKGLEKVIESKRMHMNDEREGNIESV